MYELFNWPLLGVTFTVMMLLTVANEFGNRVGRGRGNDEPEASRNITNTIKVSVIGLVAFLLGFAFSISSGRHDVRRQVVLDEANAAGTLHLRAGLLPAPERGRLRTALGRYVATRLDHFERDLGDELTQKAAMDTHLAEIWTAVEAARARDPQAVLVSQVIPAANAVIDLNTTRGWAFRSHTPPAVLAELLVSAALIGHSFCPHRRHVLLCLSFNLLFNLTLYLILYYDGARFGVIRVDHTPLLEFAAGLGTG